MALGEPAYEQDTSAASVRECTPRLQAECSTTLRSLDVAAELSGPSGYDLAALITAGIAAAMAVAALVWNLAEYRLTGPRIKAHLLFGAAGWGGLVSKKGSPPSNAQAIASQGFTEQLVGIELVNRGRVSTQVHHFGCRYRTASASWTWDTL